METTNNTNTNIFRLIPDIRMELFMTNDPIRVANKYNIDLAFVQHIYNTTVKNKITAVEESLGKQVYDEFINGASALDIVNKYNMTKEIFDMIVESKGDVTLFRCADPEGDDNMPKKKAKVKHEKRKTKAVIKQKKPDIEELVEEAEAIEEDIKNIETEDDVKYMCYEEDAAENIIDRIFESQDEECVPDTSDDTCSFNEEWYKYFGLHLFEDKMVPYKDTNVVIAGLVADRHRMPVDKYIFEEALSQELMFNYEEQERICTSFIQKNIPFENGKPTKKLIVYLSGIQCALGSICKICFDNHIDLTLKHFNAADARYYSQIIMGNGDGNCDGSFYKLKRDSKKGIYFYDCDQSKFGTDCEELYSIKISSYSDDETTCESAYIITDTYNKVWELYPSIINYINANDGIKLAIFVTKSKIIDSQFVWGAGISKGFNFK